MASWSWRGLTKARDTQAAPPLRRPVVPVELGTIPRQARPAEVTAAVPASTAAIPPPSADAVTDPASDAHLRRALALVELSRLVLDAD